MKKINPILWASALIFLLSSCDKTKEETAMITPHVEAVMERTFDYLDSSEEETVNYMMGTSEMQLTSDDEKLEIMFAPKRPVGNDIVVFKIKKSDLYNGYVGTYKIKSLSNGKSGKSELTYYHYHNNTSRSALFSTGNKMEGHIEIKSYNTTTGLATGSFVVNIKDVVDPISFETNPPKPRKCDINIEGDFNNFKLNPADNF
jgi:hypothetical protein